MIDKNFIFMAAIEDILNSNLTPGDGQSYTSLKADFAQFIFGDRFQPAETIHYYTLPTSGISNEEELKKALAENILHKTFMVFEKSVNEMVSEMQSAAIAMEKLFICPCASISIEKLSKILNIIFKINGYDSSNKEEK